MLNWTDSFDHNQSWCLFPNNGKMCDDDTKVWTKLVGWVKVIILNDWVHCAFGNVCLASLPSEWSFQLALHPSSSTIASLNSTSFICSLVLYLLRSTLFFCCLFSLPGLQLLLPVMFNCWQRAHSPLYEFQFFIRFNSTHLPSLQSVYSVLQWGE